MAVIVSVAAAGCGSDVTAGAGAGVKRTMRLPPGSAVTVQPSNPALAGPNRTFPIDVAHGLDSRASQWEKTVSRWLGASLHKTWGDNFLWGYADLQRYLAGLECSIQPVSVANYLHFSRVPASVHGLVRFYVRHLPQFLLGTWMNPWMAALVTKARKPG